MEFKDLPIKEINTFMKAYYAAEIGIAGVSEVTLSRSGLDKFLGPVIGFQRLNAAVQLVGWGALIAYLDTLEAQTTVTSTNQT